MKGVGHDNEEFIPRILIVGDFPPVDPDTHEFQLFSILDTQALRL